ncbi:T-cell differentiation antigen CD6-like, partial [Aplochiton taeniatus]
SREGLPLQICHSLGCGGVYSLNDSPAPPNTTCRKECSYQDHQLQNCTDIVASNCTILSEVVCGHQAVRLGGGGDRCAGRVELWRGGEWGTVCDDQWDRREADVVCGQLGCGYAVGGSAQGGAFPQGRGPIYLDELNCTGAESNLWACPSLREGHDCGHKEDAGVVCSEMQAVRLSGGLDRCSGKVEIHRNGTWGTICDNCWEIDMASMVCRMLGCGEQEKYSQFSPPFAHNNETLWYYICLPPHKDLWQCRKYFNNEHLCKDSHAAAVICKDSLGLPTPSTPIPTWTSATPCKPMPLNPASRK